MRRIFREQYYLVIVSWLLDIEYCLLLNALRLADLFRLFPHGVKVVQIRLR
jgi:hypothetical protein